MKKPLENPCHVQPRYPRRTLHGYSVGDKEVFSNETFEALQELGNILRGIRRKMIAQGYDIIDGVVCKIDSNTNEQRKEQS